MYRCGDDCTVAEGTMRICNYHECDRTIDEDFKRFMHAVMDGYTHGTMDE